MVILIGLTGGIACGKSTVSTFLGATETVSCIVDADQIVHELQRPGSSAVMKIGKVWPQVVDSETKELNRKALGNIIFADKAARKKLGNIMNRPIFFAIFKSIFCCWWNDTVRRVKGLILEFSFRLKRCFQKNHTVLEQQRPHGFAAFMDHQIVILDAPTLYESKMLLPYVSNVLVIACSPALQKSRLIERSKNGTSAVNLTEEEAEYRIESQMPLHEKKARAGYVIENEYTNNLNLLKRDVEESVKWMHTQSFWKLDVLFGLPICFLAGLLGFSILRLW